MICQKCKKDFPENQIEVSHDFPKYLGGTDQDGRHNLCVDCHDDYEAQILVRCYFSCFGRKISFSKDRRMNTPFMKQLQQQQWAKILTPSGQIVTGSRYFKQIASKIKDKFFEVTDDSKVS